MGLISNIFFDFQSIKTQEMRPIDILVWRCEWFEGYLLPTVKYLKHNIFRLYALKNTIFYVLLILLFPVWYEFDKILDFSEILKTRDSPKIRDHKNFMKFGKFLVFTKIPKILNFPGSSKISIFVKTGATFSEIPGNFGRHNL